METNPTSFITVKATLRIEIVPCDELHSYIDTYGMVDGIKLGPETRLGPIPNVLLEEVQREMRESWSKSMDSHLKDLFPDEVPEKRFTTMYKWDIL